MGTWGTGLYSDDTACDVRDDYRDILGDGVSEPEATERLVKEWEEQLSDPESYSVFWLALADVQWNLGRLQKRVKIEAMTIIERGSDLNRWHSDKKLEEKRRLVLERLKGKLSTTQPPEKRVKRRYVDSTDWNLGDVYGFQLQSGKMTLLHVVGFHQDRGGRGPVCEILDWIGDIAPDKGEIEKMNYRVAQEPYQHLRLFLFSSLSAKDFQRERVHLVCRNVLPKQIVGGYGFICWRSVDKQLEKHFGVK